MPSKFWSSELRKKNASKFWSICEAKYGAKFVRKKGKQLKFINRRKTKNLVIWRYYNLKMSSESETEVEEYIYSKKQQINVKKER